MLLIIVRYAIIISCFICFFACDTPPAEQLPVDKPSAIGKWRIIPVTYNILYDPMKWRYDPTGVKIFFSEKADYSVSIDKCFPSYTDESLKDLTLYLKEGTSSLITQININGLDEYVAVFYYNVFKSASEAGIRDEMTTIAIGCSTLVNSDIGDWGRTMTRNRAMILPPDQRPFGTSVSIILVGNIREYAKNINNIPYANISKHQNAVGNVLLHELGHARGIDAINTNYDHDHHGGLHQTECFMNDGVLNFADNAYICTYHINVLKNCLYDSIPFLGTYVPGSGIGECNVSLN